MRRVLILAYYFPPANASGAMRPAAFCRYLPEFGFSPHVFCASVAAIHPPIGTDDSLSRILTESVTVDSISHRNLLKDLLALRDRLRGRSGPGAAEPAGGADPDVASPSPGVLRRLKDAVLDRLFLFPDHQKYWVGPAVALARSLPAHQRPEVVLATANPWSSLVAGERIGRALGIPFVADFRDPWSRNPKPQPSAGLVGAATRLERRIVDAAALVIANTEPLRAQFVRDYPRHEAKIVTLNNGYLREMVPQRAPDTAVPPDGCVELSHFGTVYPLRNPRVLLEALLGVVRRGEVAAGCLRLRFVGGWNVEDPQCDRIAAELEGLGFLRREPSVSRDEALHQMSIASHLLILQQDFPLQIPAKLYEYLSLGRPIVVVGGQGATADLVNGKSLGVCRENTPDALAGLLRDLGSGALEVAPPDPEQVSRFDYRELTRRLAGLLEGTIAPAPGEAGHG